MSIWTQRAAQTSLISLLRQVPHRPLHPKSTRRYVQPLNFAMYPHHTTPTHISKVLVFGAGNFGSCLADHLGDSQHEVYIWSRKLSFVRDFNLHHRNPDYLQEHLFSHNIHAVGPVLPDKEFIRSMEVLLFALPTQVVRCVSACLLIGPQIDRIFSEKHLIDYGQASTIKICLFLYSSIRASRLEPRL